MQGQNLDTTGLMNARNQDLGVSTRMWPSHMYWRDVARHYGLTHRKDGTPHLHTRPMTRSDHNVELGKSGMEISTPHHQDAKSTVTADRCLAL